MRYGILIIIVCQPASVPLWIMAPQRSKQTVWRDTLGRRTLAVVTCMHVSNPLGHQYHTRKTYDMWDDAWTGEVRRWGMTYTVTHCSLPSGTYILDPGLGKISFALSCAWMGNWTRKPEVCVTHQSSLNAHIWGFNLITLQVNVSLGLWQGWSTPLVSWPGMFH